MTEEVFGVGTSLPKFVCPLNFTPCVPLCHEVMYLQKLKTRKPIMFHSGIYKYFSTIMFHFVDIRFWLGNA